VPMPTWTKVADRRLGVEGRCERRACLPASQSWGSRCR
jgi:hypothetical protein